MCFEAIWLICVMTRRFATFTKHFHSSSQIKHGVIDVNKVWAQNMQKLFQMVLNSICTSFCSPKDLCSSVLAVQKTCVYKNYYTASEDLECKATFRPGLHLVFRWVLDDQISRWGSARAMFLVYSSDFNLIDEFQYDSISILTASNMIFVNTSKNPAAWLRFDPGCHDFRMFD